MAATDTDRSLNGRQALQALSSAALALPAYAAAPPAETTVDYHYFAYSEDDIDGSKTATGTRESRFDIDGHKLAAEMPVGASYGLSADLTVESMSGASPWFVTPGTNGRPVQVMSGASIEDDREDLAVTLSRYDATRTLSGSLGHSREDDYTANYLGLQAGFEPQGEQYSYAFGVSFSDDRLEPTQDGVTPRIVRADKQQFGVQASLTQVLDVRSTLQWGLSYSRLSGYLSDPYKLVFVEESSNTAPDTRPDTRNVGAWFLRWRRHFQKLAAALHVDYRGTTDDWDLQTSTLNLRWVDYFGSNWRWSTSLRYYTQSQADFYAPYFAQTPANGLMSSDYRLSPYGAVALMTQLNYRVEALELALGFEHYESDGSLALGEVDVESPGLVDYQLINLRVAYHFE